EVRVLPRPPLFPIGCLSCKRGRRPGANVIANVRLRTMDFDPEGTTGMFVCASNQPICAKGPIQWKVFVSLRDFTSHGALLADSEAPPIGASSGSYVIQFLFPLLPPCQVTDWPPGHRSACGSDRAKCELRNSALGLLARWFRSASRAPDRRLGLSGRGRQHPAK